MEKMKFIKFEDDGMIPNNESLGVAIYPGAFKDNPETIEETFNKNGWTNSWTNGVFDYHHYHSNTHEVLGVRSGSALLLLGGEEGQEVEVHTGDVAVLPAGTGHKKISASDDFQIVGAYPGGVSPNKKVGDIGERPYVLEDIQNAPLPKTDPVYGNEGPLLKEWT